MSGSGGRLAALKAAAERPKPRLGGGGGPSSSSSSSGGARKAGDGGGAKSDVPPLKSVKTPKTSKEKSERLKKLRAQLAQRKAAATPGGPRASKEDMKRAVAARERARRLAIKPAEVHFIGELTACSGFGQGVSCRYTLDYGTDWNMASGEYETKEGGGTVGGGGGGATGSMAAGGEAAEGPDGRGGGAAAAAAGEGGEDANVPASSSGLARKPTGQTHYAYGSAFGEPVWAHPLEFHCRSKLLSGWPRLLLEVFQLDSHGRNDLVGYGIVDLPKISGSHELECATWRPRGTRQQEYSAFFLGGHPRLSATGLQVLYRDAWDHRCQLTTVPSGTVYLQVDVLMKNYDANTMHWLV